MKREVVVVVVIEIVVAVMQCTAHIYNHTTAYTQFLNHDCGITTNCIKIVEIKFVEANSSTNNKKKFHSFSMHF